MGDGERSALDVQLRQHAAAAGDELSEDAIFWQVCLGENGLRGLAAANGEKENDRTEDAVMYSSHGGPEQVTR